MSIDYATLKQRQSLPLDAKVSMALSPLGVWTEQDVLSYLRQSGISYCKIYGDIVDDGAGLLRMTGETRTGCIFCLFGLHMQKGENRIQRLGRTHPHLHRYCLDKIGERKVMQFMGHPTCPPDGSCGCATSEDA